MGHVHGMIHRWEQLTKTTVQADAEAGALPYASQKELFEVFSFKCRTPLMYYTLTPTAFTVNSEESLAENYRHIKYTDTDGVVRPFIESWINDPCIRMYQCVKDGNVRGP